MAIFPPPFLAPPVLEINCIGSMVNVQYDRSPRQQHDCDLTTLVEKSPRLISFLFGWFVSFILPEISITLTPSISSSLEGFSNLANNFLRRLSTFPDCYNKTNLPSPLPPDLVPMMMPTPRWRLVSRTNVKLPLRETCKLFSPQSRTFPDV